MTQIIVLSPADAEAMVMATIDNRDQRLEPVPIDTGPNAGMFALSIECASNPAFSDFSGTFSKAAKPNIDRAATFPAKGAAWVDPWAEIKIEAEAAEIAVEVKGAR